MKYKPNSEYYGYIYKIIIPPDLTHPYERFYFGQQKGTFNLYYWGSGLYLRNVYKKLCHTIGEPLMNKRVAQLVGIQKVLVGTAPSFKELNELEAFYVKPHLETKACLNLVAGGHQAYFSEATRKKMSDSMKGKGKGRPSPFKGKKRSKEFCEAIKKSFAGRPSHNKGKKAGEETRRKISENSWMKTPEGRTYSSKKMTEFYKIKENREMQSEAVRKGNTIEVRNKKSEITKKLFQNEEFRARHKKSLKGKCHSYLEGQIGIYHWFTNGIINKRAIECPDGFYKGFIQKKRNAI